MFINYSNHPSANWNQVQLTAANSYGKLYDMAFPVVSVRDTEEDIVVLAENQLKLLEELAKENGKTLNDTTIMCQGEFSLSYALISKIKEKYPLCKVVCAISERQVVEKQEGENMVKQVVFSFAGFREYKYKL